MICSETKKEGFCPKSAKSVILNAAEKPPFIIEKAGVFVFKIMRFFAVQNDIIPYLRSVLIRNLGGLGRKKY